MERHTLAREPRPQARALREAVTRAGVVAALMGALALGAVPPGAQAAPPSLEAASALRVVVLDPAARVVVGAKVTVTAASLRRGRTLVTGAAGEARFDRLASGTYQVHVDAKGFEPADLPRVEVEQRDTRVEVPLQIARVREDVQVRADEGAVPDQRDAFSTVLTPQQIATLPDDPDEMAQVIQDMAGPDAVIRVNGFRGGRLPPKSQIREIRFRMDPFLAENHDGGLMRVDIVTEPGQGAWRGNAQSGLSDDAVNARPAFSPERPRGGQRRLGLSLDGPLEKQKSGLSLFAEDRHNDDAKTVRAELPGGPLSAVSQAATDRVDLVGRFEQSLGPHLLRAEVQRRTQSQDGLGVGNFDLPERAYAADRTEHFLRASDTGTFGRHFTSESRLQVHLLTTSSQPATDAPAILVLGAFDAGGAQVAGGEHDAFLELSADLGYVHGRHSAYQAGRPTSYTQRTGDPLVSVDQWQLGLYAQDEFKLSRHVSLAFGLRQELQTHVSDHLNLGPRLSLAASRGHYVLRAGAGIFYSWMSDSTYEEAIRLDGTHESERLILAPGFPDPLAGGTLASRGVRSLYRLDPALGQPTVRRASFGVERPYAGGRLGLLYVFERGSSRLRSVNLNAPVPGAGRPDPRGGNVWFIESTARSTRHILRANVTFLRPESRTRLVLGYTWTHSVNEGDGPFDLPVDSRDLAAERGPARDDVRHRVTALVGTRLPRGVRLDATLRGSSGAPYDITTGRDDNGDGVSNDRPPGVGRNTGRAAAQWDLGARLSWTKSFGPEREPVGRGPRPGGGGPGGGPGMAGGGMGGGREGGGGGGEGDGRRSVTVYLQAYNALNRLNPATYVGVLSSPLFGQAISASPPRRFEAGANVSF
ncbi:MAG: hypothetical protein DMF78_00465 [Acidobacteria bacterium]|nr:MAG: hypothetical protein DMF78_00465 [Acidobacteriota bacterium]